MVDSSVPTCAKVDQVPYTGTKTNIHTCLGQVHGIAQEVLQTCFGLPTERCALVAEKASKLSSFQLTAKSKDPQRGCCANSWHHPIIPKLGAINALAFVQNCEAC